MNKETFKELTLALINEHEDFSVLSNSIEQFHDLFGGITGIKAESLTNEHMLKTENGLVVTPIHAAHCLKDILRTKKFITGVYRAILDLLETSTSQPLQILYAGCGPYATLLTPLASLFRPEEIQFTLLDFNPVSIEAVKKVYEELDLNNYVTDFIVEDATKENIFAKESFDIIVSETMQHGLKKECQVPITRNMVPMLKPSGVFVPQEIQIDAYLVGKKNGLNPKENEKTHLGLVYNLDSNNVPLKNANSSISFPKTGTGILELYTSIHLYKDTQLTAFESGLTMPIYIDNFDEKRKKPTTINFQYIENEAPDFEFEYTY